MKFLVALGKQAAINVEPWIWKWHFVMLIHKEHWISFTSISRHKWERVEELNCTCLHVHDCIHVHLTHIKYMYKGVEHFQNRSAHKFYSLKATYSKSSCSVAANSFNCSLGDTSMKFGTNILYCLFFHSSQLATLNLHQREFFFVWPAKLGTMG